jgi:hypothetical protein
MTRVPLWMIFQWRRLWNSPASANEYLVLELLRAWETSISSIPSSSDEVEEAQLCIPHEECKKRFRVLKEKLVSKGV